MILEQWQQYLADSAVPDDADAGLAWVPELALLRFEGSNARAFLQGYLTCDTGDLDPQRLLPTALCNLKGRVVMNGWCAPAGDEDVLLVLHASLVEKLTAFLEPYLMFSRHTTLADVRSEVLVLASLDLDEAPGLILDGRRRLAIVPDLAQARALWERHPHVTPERWLASLTGDGIALVSASVAETFLPQMLTANG